MNKKDISTLLETDWERLDRMTDDDIDYSDIPPLGDTFFTQARVRISDRRHQRKTRRPRRVFQRPG